MKTKSSKVIAALILAAFSVSTGLAQASNGGGWENGATPVAVPETGASWLLVGAAVTGVLLVARRFRK